MSLRGGDEAFQLYIASCHLHVCETHDTSCVHATWSLEAASRVAPLFACLIGRLRVWPWSLQAPYFGTPQTRYAYTSGPQMGPAHLLSASYMCDAIYSGTRDFRLEVIVLQHPPWSPMCRAPASSGQNYGRICTKRPWAFKRAYNVSHAKHMKILHAGVCAEHVRHAVQLIRQDIKRVIKLTEFKAQRA